MEKDTSKNTSKSITQDISAACTSLIFAILFGIYTSDEKYYSGCSEDSDLYNWGYITFIYNSISTGISCCILPGMISTLSKSQNEKITFGAGLILFTRLGMFVVHLVCFGGLCYSYGQEIPCWDSDLRRLTLAYIIIVSIGIGFAAIALSCLLCCGAAFGITMLSSKNNMNNNQHNQLSEN